MKLGVVILRVKMTITKSSVMEKVLTLVKTSGQGNVLA